MKRLTLAVIALVFCAAPITAPANQSTPVSTVKAAYGWYASLPDRSWSDRFSSGRNFFEPDLCAAIGRALEIEAKKKVVLIDFDPFAGAQYSVGGYRIGAPTISDGVARVPVTVQLSAHGGTSHVTVVLRKASSGAWLIDNFEYRNPTFNLRQNLDEVLGH